MRDLIGCDILNTLGKSGNILLPKGHRKERLAPGFPGKDEDEAGMPELYRWAQLFKAETWEEMRMLAEKNAAIKECVVTYKELTADERARMEAEAREDYQAAKEGKNGSFIGN